MFPAEINKKQKKNKKKKKKTLTSSGGGAGGGWEQENAYQDYRTKHLSKFQTKFEIYSVVAWSGFKEFFFSFALGALRFLLQFVFRNSLSDHMVSANIMILLFSPATNETKKKSLHLDSSNDVI